MRLGKMCLLGFLMAWGLTSLAQAETYTLKGPTSWFDTFVSYTYSYKYDNEPYFGLREYWRTDNTYDYRTFIRIDLSSIPQGFRVGSAKLYIKVHPSTVNTADVGLDVWRVSPFTNGITATTYDGTNAWPNGIFDGVDGYYQTPADRLLAHSYYNTNQVGTYVEISGTALTSYVRQQVQATTDRYLYLELSSEDSGASYVGYWYSSEADESLQPYLVIEEGALPTRTINEGEVPTIDGDLSDWANATWIPLDQIIGACIFEGFEVDPNQFDLTSAQFAVRWNSTTNKIYLAVTGVDTMHIFTDLTTWPIYNEVDQFVVYVDASDSDRTGYAYDMGMYQKAQQYAGGRTSNGGEFMALGGPYGVTNVNENGIVSAFKSSVNGDTISYEMEITPYDFLNIQYANNAYDLSGLANSTVVTLADGMVVGFDVSMTSRFNDYDGLPCMCERYWWDGVGEWNDASAFPDWVIKSSKIPGDANGDKSVDVGDLGILAANYGGTGKSWAEGDFNGDGLVDVGDLGILAANYGTGSQSGADFDADYAKVFGSDVSEEEATDDSTICSSFGLSLIAGLAIMGVMLVKLEE
jgi:hypothetical protein